MFIKNLVEFHDFLHNFFNFGDTLYRGQRMTWNVDWGFKGREWEIQFLGGRVLSQVGGGEGPRLGRKGGGVWSFEATSDNRVKFGYEWQHGKGSFAEERVIFFNFDDGEKKKKKSEAETLPTQTELCFIFFSLYFNVFMLGYKYALGTYIIVYIWSYIFSIRKLFNST